MGKMMQALAASDPEHRLDKFGLFLLAALVVIVLGAIVIGTYWTHGVPDKGDVLLGGISTGLILFLRDLVNAVRTSWEEVTRSKTNEQLAAANNNNPGATQEAADGADRTAEAAAAEAARIGKAAGN